MNKIWTKVLLDNDVIQRIYASKRRANAGIPTMIIELIKADKGMNGKVCYEYPFSNVFSFPELNLNHCFCAIRDFEPIGQDYDLDYMKVQIEIIDGDGPEAKVTKDQFEKNRDMVLSLGSQNLRDTPVATWICYPAGKYRDVYECSVYRGNINCNVVGSQFIAGSDVFISQINEGDEVQLIPEPTNPVNSDAIAVYWHGHQIGYIEDKRLPMIYLCMNNGKLNAEVTRAGDFINLSFPCTLQHLGEPYYNEKYGPFYAEVKIVLPGFVSTQVACSIEDYKKVFYYK